MTGEPGSQNDAIVDDVGMHDVSESATSLRRRNCFQSVVGFYARTSSDNVLNTDVPSIIGKLYPESHKKTTYY